MDAFGNERKEKVKQRIANAKEISKKLKADYYYGINTIKSIFNLYSDSEMEESNVIVGKIEDHDYCFIEYYHVGTGRNNHSHWNTNLYMKTKNNDFPNFHLKTKSSTTSLAVLLIIFASIFFIGSIILLGTMLFGKVEGANMFNLFGVIIISLFFLVVSSIILIININTLKNTYKQDPYGILNSEFKRKYVIFSEEPVEKIRKIFTEKVCSKILKEKSDLNIEFKNNVIYDWIYDGQLSLKSCNSHLSKLLRKVKLFETENDNLD